MGYKLAGYEVIGNNEIDPAINKVYRANHNPRFNFECDVRELVSDDNLPDELYNIDILDGSPPCSVFSTAGKRADGWGVVKKFREGQKDQRLDDLFFAFIALAKKLQPIVVVAENVPGLIKGQAKGYVAEIMSALDDAGYNTQIFRLNAAFMGVPQARERVFFIAHRKDMAFNKLFLEFKEKPIPYGVIRAENGIDIAEGTLARKAMENRRRGDKAISDINERTRGKSGGFTNAILSDERVAPTIASGGSYYRMHDGTKVPDEDFVKIQSFPTDFDFVGQSVQYICGMSVPPVMMAQIAKKINEQWLTEEGT